MKSQPQDGMQCGEFDALLADALDHTLTGTRLESFQAHAQSCSICGPLLSEAEQGQRWLKQMVEVEPPAGMVENILLATTGLSTVRLSAGAPVPSERSFGDRLRDWANLLVSPIVAAVRQPRFVMSFGMAFFSLSVSLNLAGVKMGDIREIDLRPSAIKREYYETSGKIVKYYENIRFVYEIESRVREFKRATTPAEPPREEKQEKPKSNTSDRPDEKQERNYSQGDSELIFASLPDHPPVVKLATLRRMI
jgi:hypothetical protein